MRIAIFSTHKFEREFFQHANLEFKHTLDFFDARLTEQTTSLAAGYGAVCAFVSDQLDEKVIERLKSQGTRLVALRSAGFNHVDLETAARFELPVVRVPEYSPYAVAEHAVCLILALNRKIHRAYNRVRESNFNLDGLVGFDLHGKTVGVIGTGRIGAAFARIMRGFGCRVLAYDPTPNDELCNTYGVQYVELDKIYSSSDVISLHVPLTPKTRHLIDDSVFMRMKRGAMLINTGRGALVDAQALITALKCGTLGAAGLDVYEEEEGVFFEDLSDTGLKDDTLARLLTFPNVLITSHQAFLTAEALSNIAATTLRNVADFEAGRPLVNEVRAEPKGAKRA
ncbi:MAG: 2-hydroxyacid dehydrogenase [Deltaproteobacteria bacterium]|nr:2-hydroxyacid dehydrogenase [Deltaproteobacteria bacterium]